MNSYLIRMQTEPTELLIKANCYADALDLADQLDDHRNTAEQDYATGAMVLRAWGITRSQPEHEARIG